GHVVAIGQCGDFAAECIVDDDGHIRPHREAERHGRRLDYRIRVDGIERCVRNRTIELGGHVCRATHHDEVHRHVVASVDGIASKCDGVAGGGFALVDAEL